jgi:hypothetical protein
MKGERLQLNQVTCAVLFQADFDLSLGKKMQFEIDTFGVEWSIEMKYLVEFVFKMWRHWRYSNN